MIWQNAETREISNIFSLRSGSRFFLPRKIMGNSRKPLGTAHDYAQSYNTVDPSVHNRFPLLLTERPERRDHVAHDRHST
jgi:hypothetical protein